MGIFDLLWAYIVIFVLAALPFFEAYGVIAVAILAGLPVIPVIVIGIIGNIVTVLLLILFINKFKEWRRKRKGDQGDKQPSKRMVRAQNLWKKYGLPGLSFVGPLIVGSHLTAFMGITLGGTRKMTSIWMVISITVWGIVFAVLAHLGIDFLGFQDQDFIKNLINR